MAQLLTLADIADQRAYERERAEFRRSVIALKHVRRVAVGPLLSAVFENRTTIRFQVQEMARAERLISDEQIQGELNAYNLLIPSVGECSLTLFIELTREEELREWLPKLVGIERSLYLRLGDGPAAEFVAGELDPAHASQLTREETTASVHYLRFHLSERQMEHFAAGNVALGTGLDAYRYETELSEETRASIAADWVVE